MCRLEYIGYSCTYNWHLCTSLILSCIILQKSPFLTFCPKIYTLWEKLWPTFFAICWNAWKTYADQFQAFRTFTKTLKTRVTRAGTINKHSILTSTVVLKNLSQQNIIELKEIVSTFILKDFGHLTTSIVVLHVMENLLNSE